MTIAPAKQATQLRAATFGPQIFNTAVVIPTGSTTIWNVSGGPVAITNVELLVATTMSGTATTVNIGCVLQSTGAASAAALMSAGVVTSLVAGASVLGIPVLSSPGLGSVIATIGAITWIASAGNTGTAQVYLSYIPLVLGATVG
jgi:hypothetical protein